MEKAISLLWFACFILTGLQSYSQTKVSLSDPRLEAKNSTLQISYDILNGAPDEKYVISIDIKDEKGNLIKANTLNGDIGMVEEAGRNKQIIWDPGADHIFINSKIYVKVNAEIILPPQPVQAGNEEKPIEQQGVENEPVKEVAPAETGATEKRYSRAGLILQSLAVPGLGLSRSTGKPHWLRGVVGYGCLIGSVALNQVAWNTYDGIGDLTEYEEKEDMYRKASNQNSISRVFAYTAAAVWAADVIWTIVGTSDMGGSTRLSRSEGFSVGSTLDPLSNVPMVSLKYSF